MGVVDRSLDQPLRLECAAMQLAGGIGLSGSACRILGAAIWFTGIHTLKNVGKLSFNFTAPSGELKKFLVAYDYEFECAKIVGHKFENVADHAGYVRGGGCAKIIKELAAYLAN
jgi:hypothetical protein